MQRAYNVCYLGQIYEYVCRVWKQKQDIQYTVASVQVVADGDSDYFWHSVYILYNYCTFDSKMLATFNYQLCQCNFKIVLNLGEFFKLFCGQ